MDEATIIATLDELKERNGGEWSDYYVGISENGADRLEKGHRVDLDNVESYVVCSAESEELARTVEDLYVNLNGADGGTGGGDHPHEVYAYLKQPGTNP